jgi:hypothetical protein
MEKQTTNHGVEVKPQGPRNWGVYVNGFLHEGGFFYRDSAQAAAARLRDELTKERA